MIGTKETLCTRCGHKAVCSLSGQLLAAQKELDNIYLCGDKDNSIIRLVDIDWLNTTLTCRHYIANQNQR